MYKWAAAFLIGVVAGLVLVAGEYYAADWPGPAKVVCK